MKKKNIAEQLLCGLENTSNMVSEVERIVAMVMRIVYSNFPRTGKESSDDRATVLTFPCRSCTWEIHVQFDEDMIHVMECRIGKRTVFRCHQVGSDPVFEKDCLHQIHESLPVLIEDMAGKLPWFAKAIAPVIEMAKTK